MAKSLSAMCLDRPTQQSFFFLFSFIFVIRLVLYEGTISYILCKHILNYISFDVQGRRGVRAL
jgi:hypothetical protein